MHGLMFGTHIDIFVVILLKYVYVQFMLLVSQKFRENSNFRFKSLWIQRNGDSNLFDHLRLSQNCMTYPYIR